LQSEQKEAVIMNGDNHPGGDVFDERIVNHLTDIIQKEHHVDVRRDFSALQRVTKAAERAEK